MGLDSATSEPIVGPTCCLRGGGGSGSALSPILIKLALLAWVLLQHMLCRRLRMALFQLVTWCLPPGGHGYRVAAGAWHGTRTTVTTYIIRVDTRWHLYRACRRGSKPLRGGNCCLCDCVTLLVILDSFAVVVAFIAAIALLGYHFTADRKNGGLLVIAIAMIIVTVLEVLAFKFCIDENMLLKLAYYLPSEAVNSAKTPRMSWHPSTVDEKMYWSGKLLRALNSDGSVLASTSTRAANGL
jgi:hypothetical protein